MKTKKTSKTNTRSRIIFFAIALTYNLLLGLYLKDFLVLSPMFTTFYILSVLPMLFLLVDTRSKIMIQAFYHWMIQNFEYDYEADPLIQYFDIRRTLRTRNCLCYDFSCLRRFVVVRTFPAMSLTECLDPIEPIFIHGIGFTTTALGGTWT